MEKDEMTGRGRKAPLPLSYPAVPPGRLVLICLIGLVALLGLVPAATAQTSGPCAPPVTNPIACENTKAGNPASEWDITGAGDPTIQGFATQISVNKGETVRFKIDTDATNYRLDIYRLGYYGGLGARKIATVQPSATLPQPQPSCLSDETTGLVDCGNWSQSASWTVPTTSVSGLYVVKLVRGDSFGASHIVFVVRDDASQSDILYQTSDTTWQAYNDYGGNSFYVGSPANRAYKVSYNRPFVTRGNQFSRAWLFDAEYPMIRWLEANGFNVSYSTGVDTDRQGSLLLQHKIFMSSGHDEYWSATQRANVEAARNAGRHLAFFSGNEVFWKTRWEPSIDGSNTAYRTLVTYKETHANAKIDPSPTWTGTWRDPRFSPPADGGRPENSLTGTIFMVNCCRFDGVTVSSEEGKLRFWRNTSLATLPTGESDTIGAGTVGYEWDEVKDNGVQPPGQFRLSSTTLTVGSYLLDFGSTFGQGVATHSLTQYRHSSGALVFGAGTIRWAWGLDDQHDDDPASPGFIPPIEAAMRQATVNLLADMGAQPSTLQPGLVPATASTDVTKPVSTVTAPGSGTSVQSGVAVLVTGTATDVGGKVAAVEVSVDGGNTWHPATGRGPWSYSWTPGTPGTATIKSRAVDDTGNLETAGPTVTVTVVPRTCPCSFWGDGAVPATASDIDTAAVEVGVKFYSDVDGYISGLRFYKGPGNTGTHIGNLWSASGALLATAVFSGETATGWQQVAFSAPVQIHANTVYVASYHAPNGGYAFNSAYFTSLVSFSPLYAPADVTGNGNGVYKYGASGFPNQAYNANNYWVDVVFSPAQPDTIAPLVVGTTPAAGATRMPLTTTVTAVFSEAVTPGSISFQLRDPSNTVVPASVSYNAFTRTVTLTPSSPLAESIRYTVLLQGAADQAGNVIEPVTWQFKTIGPGTSLWNTPVVPAQVDSGDPEATEVGVKFRSDVNGYITGLTFYKSAANTGVHTANLWTSTGTLLSTAVFSNETASGWQDVSLPTPVAISANTTYVASYHAPSGHYSSNSGYFTSTGLDNPPLHAPSSVAAGGNGVYKYGASGFPTSTYNGNNYWVDVVFSATLPPDTVPPTVVLTNPANAASKVAPSATVTAKFSEPVTAGSVSFQLRTSANVLVPATTTYDPATLTATLTPNGPLAEGATYSAVVSGAVDTAGNGMTGPASWSFSTLSCPCSLWSAGTTPATVDSNDAQAVEVGVKFSTQTAGYVAGVRFYKATTNTGPHTANLWNASGTLLATTTFTAETASGWQEVSFTPPVPITTNTTYVASYHAPSGHYSITSGYFNTTGVDNFPLLAGSSSSSGGNGVFKYGASGFPTETFNGGNYWVDVVFSLTVPPDTTLPAVVSVNPANGATGVPNNMAVTVTFSESMDASTISTSTIELRDSANSLVPATVTYNVVQKAATVTPATSFAPLGSYTARVLGGSSGPRVKDLAGNALAATFTSSFTAATDTTPPTVVSVNPANGATGVADNATVTVTFNESMNPATISTSTIELRAGSSGPVVAATVGYTSATRAATLSPASPLLAGTPYTVTVRGGATDPRVKDAFDNPLATTFTSSFTTGAAPPSVAGQWSAPATWPHVAVHAMLLKTGDVLLWDGPSEDDTTHGQLGGGDTATLWNPTTNTFTAVPNLATNLFCAGHAVLADGRILVLGGHVAGGVGLRDANIFDPITRQWTTVAPMNYPRWYPTATTLSDGRVLVVSGSTTCQACIADVPEVYDPVTNSWTPLPHAQNPVELYPYNFLLRDGRVVAVGGYDAASFVTKTLDIASQTWTDVDPRPLDGGSAAMYLPGKIVKSGSARRIAGQLSNADTWVIDMDAALPTWRQTAPMNFPRMYHTMTSLPDGTVLVTGGGRVGDTSNLSAAVMQAEAWSPATETWTVLGSMQTPRLYHSIALLLPDGRVLVAGSGRTEGVDQLSAEVYSPPYLFKGARPAITSAPPSIQYGGSFIVGTPDGGTIVSASLIRAGSVTHTFHADQRFLPLTFHQVSGGLQIDAPVDANLAPPGNYMLFLVNANGVPSVAPFISLSALNVVRDGTFADFAAGTPDANIHVADGQDEVILRPSMVSDFSGTQLPVGWSSTPWQTGGTSTVNGGLLRVDGARAGTDALRGFGTLEFGAIFGSDPYQHVGVGLTLNETPWAIFSTGAGGQLWARTHDGTTATDTLLTGAEQPLLNTPHVFRIDWTPSAVVFSIDENVVASHPVAITGTLRPLVSDFAAGAANVVLDWLRMSPYPASGTFLSRVFDGGGQVKWGPLWWEGYTPPGTTLVLSARTGNTAVPDGSWSAFVPIANSGASIGKTARYVQYRAVLSTNDAKASPALWGVTIGNGTP
jgi:N,N-dimethylformamidase beta subunit-like protein/uncharacterized protein DUF4082/galactose oxidase-like protein/Big-like domain-containing protein/Kelch motif protein